MTEAQLRSKWQELSYDSIMSNDPGNFVWNTLREQARGMTEQQLIEAVADMTDCEPEELK